MKWRMKMSWKGRKGNECEVITYCDFGDPNRKEELTRHKNLDTAKRQFRRIKQIYTDIHGWDCWQEDV